MGNDWMSAAFAACVMLASAASIAAAVGELKKAAFKGIIGQSALGAVAAALAFLLFLAGLGRPSLCLEILRDPTSRFFWKAAPLVCLAVFLVGYIVLQYRSAGRRSTEVCVILAAASGVIGAAALGAVQKLPLRPLLDTNLTALVFLSLLCGGFRPDDPRRKNDFPRFPCGRRLFLLGVDDGLRPFNPR